MVKVVLVGMVAVFVIFLLKAGKPEFAMAVSLGTCILLLLYAVGTLSDILGEVKRMLRLVNLPEEYLKILFKILGISYLAEFGSALCKDAGQGAIAGQIEFVGKLAILAVSLPVVTTLFETISRMAL